MYIHTCISIASSRAFLQQKDLYLGGVSKTQKPVSPKSCGSQSDLGILQECLQKMAARENPHSVIPGRGDARNQGFAAKNASEACAAGQWKRRIPGAARYPRKKEVSSHPCVQTFQLIHGEKKGTSPLSEHRIPEKQLALPCSSGHLQSEGSLTCPCC